MFGKGKVNGVLQTNRTPIENKQLLSKSLNSTGKIQETHAVRRRIREQYICMFPLTQERPYQV